MTIRAKVVGVRPGFAATGGRLATTGPRLRWVLNRLRTMGTAEAAYRLTQLARALSEKHTGLGLAKEVECEGVSGKAWLPKFPDGLDPLPYRMEADEILAGRFKIFESVFSLGFPPAWNRDPKTNTEAPLEFGKTINYRDEHLVGDVKHLWELNRHREILVLAQAYYICGEARFGEGCRLLVDSWLEANPYPLGVNWSSSLEQGLRLLNWAFSWYLLGGDRSALFHGVSGDSFRKRWLNSIHQHCHFISRNLSRHSSANNHLLGELMGLFVGSLVWPYWPESLEWSTSAAREFEHEALMQTAPDGVNREQAVYYQYAVMEMMLVSGLFGRANGVEFADPYWERLERMADFLTGMMDRSGNVPMIGDADDARIVGLGLSTHRNPYRPLLGVCAVLFSRGDFKVAAGNLDDKVIWLLGSTAKQVFDRIESGSHERQRSFPDGGYFLFSSRRGEAREVLACVDCGPIGYTSIAAHGHADALSLTLSAGGIPLLIDPGTYSYHTEAKWRDYFRSTYAHTTVRVDGVDQSVSGGNFMWLRKATAKVLAYEILPQGQRFSGEHDGYVRLPDPVVHRRTIEFDARLNRFVVGDDIDCSGDHLVEIAWHFSERCRVVAEGAGVRATTDKVELLISLKGRETAPCLIRGETDPPGGWISYAYGVKLPTTMAVWSFIAHGRSCFEFELQVVFKDRDE